MPVRPGNAKTIARSSPDAHAPDESGVVVPSSLVEWVRYALAPSGQRPARHHLLLLALLDSLSRGEIDRLMVLMPPGSAKSTYAYVNSDLWGAYIGTPVATGTYYVWCEGADGSVATVFPTSIAVG